MAPVSTKVKPSRRASSFETLLFPAPAGPSMATMKGRIGEAFQDPAVTKGPMARNFR